MKRIILIIICTLILTSSVFSMTKVVGMVRGMCFDPISTQFIPTELKIYVDDTGLIYINIPEVNYASYFFEEDEFEKFTKFIKKSVLLGKKAQEQNIALSREIGRLTKSLDNGNGKKRFDMHTVVSVHFLALPKGRRQNLILNIKGFKHRKAETKIYIDMANSDKLVALLKKAPEVSEKFIEKQKIIQGIIQE